MDLSSFFTSQGKGNMLGALLPLLLGGKTPDLGTLLGANGGTQNLLASLFSLKSSDPSSETGFPPLFGGTAEKAAGMDSPDLMKLLGGLSASSAPVSRESKVSEYPYELQYNRPYRKEDR